MTNYSNKQPNVKQAYKHTITNTSTSTPPDLKVEVFCAGPQPHHPVPVVTHWLIPEAPVRRTEGRDMGVVMDELAVLRVDLGEFHAVAYFVLGYSEATVSDGGIPCLTGRECVNKWVGE